MSDEPATVPLGSTIHGEIGLGLINSFKGGVGFNYYFKLCCLFGIGGKAVEFSA